MVVSSTQRPMRISRSQSIKKEASTPKQSTTTTPPKATIQGAVAETGKDDVKKEAAVETIATESKKEKEKEEPSSVTLPHVQDTNSVTGVPRRSMTRTRKPSSRLLPSPSPPPSRSSSHYHYSTKANAPTTAVSPNPATNTTKITQKKQHAANSSPATTTPATESMSTTATGTLKEKVEEKEDYGPGKRKRRPSTMTKPPSTITKSTISIPVHQSGAPSSSSTGGSLKPRVIRIASKSQTPEEKGSSNLEKTSKKVKSESIVRQTGPTSLRLPALTKRMTETGGYESDGNAEGTRLVSLIETEADCEADEDSDAGIASIGLKKIAGGARSKGYHALSAAREKFGARRWPTSTGCNLEPPPLISRRGGLKAHQGFSHASQRSSKQGVESNHLRSQSTSVLDGKWGWTPSGIAPILRFRLAGTAGEDETSEASDLEEEDDFHVAMLDGGDFGEPHHRKAPSFCSKSSHRDSKSEDDSENEDTPATTPRSPQSTCDLPERRWSTGVDEEEKENRKGSKDAVFAHALEPSSRRPHTHAGSLTLSLPFDEMVQNNEEEQSSVPMSKSRSRDGETAQIVSDARGAGIKEEEDGTMAAGLLSPAVHPSILGLSSKHHALMPSSPHSSSAFASPAFEASTLQGVKNEPVILTLPPPASLPKTGFVSTTEGKVQPKRGVLRNTSSINAIHSSDEEEEDHYEHAALIMEPPERMCLSELDRAWEQSEYSTSTKRRSTDDKGEDDEGSEMNIEESMDEAKADVREAEEAETLEEEEEEYERIERPRKGSKRGSLGFVKEEPIGKRTKASPKHKSPSRNSRRSTRQSGIKT